MSHWKELTLGEFSRPKQWPTLAKTDLADTGFPVYGANGPIGFHDEFTHENPTILIGCRGSCGTIHITPPKAYANGNAMALDDLDESRVDINFLANFFRWRGFKDVITGTSQPQIIGENLKRVKVPLPELAEQRRIAAILDKANALRVKRHEALTQVDRLAQSIFVQMFGDPLTNPNRLEKNSLGDLLKVKSGDFLPASAMANDGQYPVFGGNGVNGHHDEYMFDDRQIVVGRVGVYCGCVHITPANSWVTDNALYVSEHNPKIDFDFLAYSLKLANLNQYASQSAQPLISGARIYPVEIFVPPLEQQAAFIARINAAKKLEEQFTNSSNELDALISTLRHRAFRGEL